MANLLAIAGAGTESPDPSSLPPCLFDLSGSGLGRAGQVLVLDAHSREDEPDASLRIGDLCDAYRSVVNGQLL